METFRKQYDEFKQNIEKLDLHFNGSFQSVQEAENTGVPFSVCGICREKMTLLLKLQPQRLYCANCEVRMYAITQSLL